MTIILETPQEIREDIAARFRARRLAMNLTQKELASRSGVAWGSLKRFESRGLIALDALLNISLVLGCLKDFEKIAAEGPESAPALSLDALLARPAPRRRARPKRGMAG